MIIPILNDICVNGLKVPFRHGQRSLANINNEVFPSAFLYPVELTDEFGKYANVLETDYHLLMDFHNLCEVDATPEKITDVIHSMYLLSTEFLRMLKAHPQVKTVTDIRREPLYHVLSENACGYALSCKVRLDIIVPPYCG